MSVGSIFTSNTTCLKSEPIKTETTSREQIVEKVYQLNIPKAHSLALHDSMLPPIIALKKSKMLQALDEISLITSESLQEELGMNPDELFEVLRHLLQFLDEPVHFFSFLQDVEHSLEQKLQERDVSFSFEHNPKYLFAGLMAYFPGPPICEIQDLPKKNRILNEVLRESESHLGINKKGVPLFIGFVPRTVADLLVGQMGCVFQDGAKSDIFLLHGKNSHRFQIIAIMKFLQNSLSIPWSATNLLRFLVEGKVVFFNQKELSLWDFLLDQAEFQIKIEIKDPTERLLLRANERNYVYSCTSAFLLQSLLMTRGAEFGLPNLQRCLVHSFWKSVNKIFEEYKASGMPVVSFDQFYVECLERHFLAGKYIGDIGKVPNFSIPRLQYYLNSRFSFFDLESLGIHHLILEKLQDSLEKDQEMRKQKWNRLYESRYISPEACFDDQFQDLVLEHLDSISSLDQLQFFLRRGIPPIHRTEIPNFFRRFLQNEKFHQSLKNKIAEFPNSDQKILRFDQNFLLSAEDIMDKFEQLFDPALIR